MAGRRVAVDAAGHLLDPAGWDAGLARAMAAADGIELSPAHWQVIDFLRDWHGRHGKSPPMRVLVRELALSLGAERAESRVLYRLFPQGPAKQAARYAGLPRPTSCI
ncbi:MAG: TusE/DsrC/DsvC family sulfur relay protein [Xanthomonadales bacterium]|nr:TusE/DsrC/DsvC family sulfur relay protein [Xanthomonadales bacterium]